MSSFTLQGLDKALSVLDDVEKAAFKKKLMTQIGEFLAIQAHRRVDKQIDIFGRTIKPSVRAELEHGETLRDTGAMLGGYRILTASEGKVVVGFRSRLQHTKAAAHQFGTRRGLPRRAVFDVSDNDVTELGKMIDAAIQKVSK